jgi:hypothetical protein
MEIKKLAGRIGRQNGPISLPSIESVYQQVPIRPEKAHKVVIKAERV